MYEEIEIKSNKNNLFKDEEYNILKNNLKINKNNFNILELLDNFCRITDDILIIEIRFFKFFGMKETYSLFQNYLMENIDKLINKNKLLTIYLNTNMININDIEKHSDYLKNLSKFMSDKYPECLDKCYIYGYNLIFKGIYMLLSTVICKETRSKIIFIK